MKPDEVKKITVTPAILRELLLYDPETGDLIWRPRAQKWFSRKTDQARWNGRFANKIAGDIRSNGYRRVAIFYKQYFAHRVVFAMQTGEWPKSEIDHIDHDRSNNRWSNLRIVSSSENQKNATRSKNNLSGVTGVGWDRSRGKWCAYIRHNGRKLNLGRFANFDEAVAARSAANHKFNFHPNHGANRKGSTDV